MGVDDVIFNDYPKLEFESLCAGALRQAFLWKTERTSKTRDGGKDIIVTTGEGKTIYVECKAWGARVEPKEIRAFHSVCLTDHVSGIFISVSGYTPKALEEAKTKRIKTYDASDLMAMILSYDSYKKPILYSFEPITMGNAAKNKVGVFMVANSLKRPAIPKVRVTIDGMEMPPVGAEDILYVAIPDGRHSVEVKIAKEVKGFVLDLKGEASAVVSSKLISKTGYEIVVNQ